MTLLTQVEYTRVKSDRLWFARRGSSGHFPKLIFKGCKTGASSQPPPETISLNSNSMRPVPQFHHQPPHLVCGLAMPKHKAQLKPRPGQRVSLTPLHLFCIQCTQLAQTWHWYLHLYYRQHMDRFNPYIQYNHCQLH